jgi:hypothetical protein
MGALIQTRGTQRLVRHYNQLFNKGALDQTRKTIIADAVLVALFSTPTNASLPIRDITNHNSAVFLPPIDNTNHPNLLARWDFFLHFEFAQANHELLRGFLANALNLQSGANGPTGVNQKGDNYTAIHFDCVQAAAGQPQTVLQSDEYKLKGNDEDNDTGLVRAKAYSLIVLVTALISNNAPPPDNQNIQ